VGDYVIHTWLSVSIAATAVAQFAVHSAVAHEPTVLSLTLLCVSAMLVAAVCDPCRFPRPQLQHVHTGP